MNWHLILLICILANISFQNYTYDVKYISIPLDHFSFTNNATFQLRYLINNTYWDLNGPIFFYTGNEGNIEMFAQSTGFMWEIAAEFRASIVFAEHRYYGDSLPFGNLSFTAPEYVGYLTSTQALADYVYLIDYLQEPRVFTKVTNNPTIAFGGSYGGMLAAWLRIKYPASVIGAIASSAPIWQFGNIVPCDTFNKLVTSVYKVASSYDCSKIINASWGVIRQVAATMEGKEWLSINWKLCSPLEKDEDIKVLLKWLADVYGNLAMVNYPYATDFFANLPPYPVKEFCNKLKHHPSSGHRSLLIRLRNALSVYINNTGQTKCMNIFSAATKLSEIGWDFQSCTELVMPLCSKESDMFISQEWNFTRYSQKCYNKWKIRVTTEKLAILEYGGRHLESASNIVFSNGLLDPWYGGGVLEDISKTVVAYVIPEAAHHLDLRGSNPHDPPVVNRARSFHRRMIRHWLRTY